MSDGTKYVLLIIYGYMCIYTIEFSSALYYGMPLSLISPDINNFLTWGFIAFIFSIIFIFILVGANEFSKRDDDGFSVFLYCSLKYLIPASSGLLAYKLVGYVGVLFVLFLVLPLVCLLLELIVPLFKKGDTYYETFKREAVNLNKKLPISSKYSHKITEISVYFLIFVYSINALVLLGCLSYYSEKKSETYMLIDGRAVIAVYGDSAITASYSSETKILLNEFKVVSLEGSDIKIEKIGNLSKYIVEDITE